MSLRLGTGAAIAYGAAAFSAAMARAAETGRAHVWQFGFQEPASPVAVQIDDLHDTLLYIIFAIAAFVILLLLYVIWRYRETRNPEPSKTTHNTLLELVWTLVPVLILGFIAVPSLRLLYKANATPPNIELTIKAIGNQWNWSYVYQDNGNFTFVSTLTCRTHAECKAAAKGGRTPIRLLDVDNPVVVPVGTNIRLLVTASDVVHAWAVPALGIRIDAVPGRVNEVYLHASKQGTFYGQCSELCGRDHGFMPIAVKVVSKEAYARWVREAQAKFEKAK